MGKAVRGQVSIEYMLILGFMFLLMAPLIILFANTQKDTTDTLVEGQLLNVGNTIRDVAERVYFAGDPAQEQVQVYLPQNVKTINITNTSIVFTVFGGPGEYDLLINSLVPLNGTFLINKGVHVVTIRASAGIVQIYE